MSQVDYREGRNRMEARLGDEVIGFAVRSRGHNDDEWAGWLVELTVMPDEREVLPTRESARLALKAKVDWLLDEKRRADVAAAVLES